MKDAHIIRFEPLSPMLPSLEHVPKLAPPMNDVVYTLVLDLDETLGTHQSSRLLAADHAAWAWSPRYLRALIPEPIFFKMAWVKPVEMITTPS